MLTATATDFFFFFNDTATTEIYTLSLHDALPISPAPSCTPEGDDLSAPRPRRRGSRRGGLPQRRRRGSQRLFAGWREIQSDRKSTRLNSSHGYISYAVFCLKKKTRRNPTTRARPT